MVRLRPPTETIEVADAEQRFGEILNRVAHSQERVLVEQDGTPVAAIVSAEDLDRLTQLDAERADDFAIFDEIGAAFADVDPEEIERETVKALAAVRAELRAEREAAGR